MRAVHRKLKDLTVLIVDTVLPHRCVVTGAVVERAGMVAPRVWGALDFIARPFCECCGAPFEFEVEERALCAGCLERRPSFGCARAALAYNECSRDIVLGFKHGDQTHAVKAFMPWMVRAGREVLDGADFLVPVPLHRWRLLARRYNQAALIAQALAKETGIPCLPDALVRVRATPSQGHLSPKERRKNIRRAFAVQGRCRERLKGRRVLLIDDVYTTGSTVDECTKILLKSGAASVNVLTLARVVKGAHY